jgi:putative ABC transport system ATP-binding protein
VAIARALAHDPGLILADEPTGNLDSQSGIQILQLLQRLSSEGRTVLVVSHDPRVLHFASHTLYILDGRAVDEGEYNASLALAGLEVIPNEA